MKRPSEYLVQKCNNLLTALNFFFKGNEYFTAKSKRIIFLSQIDYWDWELEELIFSFKNFRERGKAWSPNADVYGMLVAKGFDVKVPEVNELVYSQARLDANQVYAPVDNLNEVIEKFNELLILSVKILNNGNLDKYKKELVGEAT